MKDTKWKDKDNQRKIIMKQFVCACEQIMTEQGYNKTSAREIAKRTGYNQATLYNYFDNLEHLRFFGAMRLIKDYSRDLKTYIAGAKNAMDVFMFVWECFCDHAFDKPGLYQHLFFHSIEQNTDDIIASYYKLFPEDLESNLSDTITTMLVRTSIEDRAMANIDDLVKEGYIDKKDAISFNEITLITFEGMLLRVLKNNISYNNACAFYMDFLERISKSYLLKPYEFKYTK